MKQLQKAFEQLNIPLNENTKQRFEKYMELVLARNEKINLTSITDRTEFIKKHFIDSVLCAGAPEVEKASSVIDVGTGAGFPGVPLALIYPEKSFLLIDSLAKRLKIIQEFCETLKIQNVTVAHGRAEDLARAAAYRERFDLCVSRAVAPLAVLSEYCLPFIKTEGTFLAYKGPEITVELQNAQKAILILGGEVVSEKKVYLEDFDLDHNILFIKKVKKTPSKYPRKAGMPSKEPLK